MTPAIETTVEHLRLAASSLLAEANRVRPHDYKLFETLMDACVHVVQIEQGLKKIEPSRSQR